MVIDVKGFQVTDEVLLYAKRRYLYGQTVFFYVLGVLKDILKTLLVVACDLY